MGVFLCTLTHHQGGYQAPCRCKSDPHPRIAIPCQDLLGRGEMRLFLAHKAPQFVHLTLGDMSGVEQPSGHSTTMPASLVEPGTDGVLININDAAGAP